MEFPSQNSEKKMFAYSLVVSAERIPGFWEKGIPE
jgi:hypothetical protein